MPLIQRNVLVSTIAKPYSLPWVACQRSERLCCYGSKKWPHAATPLFKLGKNFVEKVTSDFILGDFGRQNEV